jgi:hypothetical protein
LIRCRNGFARDTFATVASICSKSYSTTGETVVADIHPGLGPSRISGREFDDAVGDDEGARADIACSAFRQVFEEAQTDADELPSFRPLVRGVPAPRLRARAVPRDPPPCDAPLPFSRARALAAGEAALPAMARAAPRRDGTPRSVRRFLLTAIFLAGTIAGLGGAVAARVDRLDAGKVAEARRALSLLVDTVAWREASSAGELAARRPRALPTRVESSLPAHTATVTTTASDVAHPWATAAPASEHAIPAPPARAPAASFALERGDEAMRQRDVIAARRFYEFAASGGVAGAAVAVARSYDPLYLQQLGIRGVKPDTEAALRWYKRASTEGDPATRPR